MGMLFTTVRSPNRFVMPWTSMTRSEAVMEKLIFADEKLKTPTTRSLRRMQRQTTTTKAIIREYSSLL